MKKQNMGARAFLYPMPVVLIGANVSEKPNYMTLAFCSIVSHTPPVVALGLNKNHYTCKGIDENKTFSVNIPSADMVEVTDYCGIFSGNKKDKAALFTNFYGILKTAPMIAECPINMECKLIKVIDYGSSNQLFLGEIVDTYCREEYLTNGLPDISKFKPLIFTFNDNNYWSVGDRIGQAWNIGKRYNA